MKQGNFGSSLVDASPKEVTTPNQISRSHHAHRLHAYSISYSTYTSTYVPIYSVKACPIHGLAK